MKTIKYCFLLLTLAILVSCSKDEDEPSVDNSLIEGEWNIEEYEYSGTTTISQGGSTMTASYTGKIYDIDARLILNSDDTYRSEGSYTVELTTNYDGETMVEDMPFSDISSTGTYRIENSKIFAEGNLQQQPEQGQLNMAVTEGTIVELTANRLVITFHEDLTQEQQGLMMDISIEGQQILSR